MDVYFLVHHQIIHNDYKVNREQVIMTGRLFKEVNKFHFIQNHIRNNDDSTNREYD